MIDVTDDYRLLTPPLPTHCYPVLRETWLPTAGLLHRIPHEDLVSGYLYDWHEVPETLDGCWYVGVVHAEMAMKWS